MKIEKLLNTAVENKNIKALNNLKDAAINNQQYEIASEIKKIIEFIMIEDLPEYCVLEKTEQDTYTNTVYYTHLEVSGNFIGLINTGNIIRFEKSELELILYTMNNKVRKS